MLAHSQGDLANDSKIGANLDMDSKSVARYISILVDLLLVRKILPWHGRHVVIGQWLFVIILLNGWILIGQSIQQLGLWSLEG